MGYIDEELDRMENRIDQLMEQLEACECAYSVSQERLMFVSNENEALKKNLAKLEKKRQKRIEKLANKK